MKMNNDYDFLYKLLLIGDYGVGKSSLLLRYTDDTYTDYHITTISAEFKIHYVDLDGSRIFTYWMQVEEGNSAK